jgi:hypothetical protein
MFPDVKEEGGVKNSVKQAPSICDLTSNASREARTFQFSNTKEIVQKLC